MKRKLMLEYLGNMHTYFFIVNAIDSWKIKMKRRNIHIKPYGVYLKKIQVQFQFVISYVEF